MNLEYGKNNSYTSILFDNAEPFDNSKDGEKNKIIMVKFVISLAISAVTGGVTGGAIAALKAIAIGFGSKAVGDVTNVITGSAELGQVSEFVGVAIDSITEIEISGVSISIGDLKRYINPQPNIKIANNFDVTTISLLFTYLLNCIPEPHFNYEPRIMKTNQNGLIKYILLNEAAMTTLFAGYNVINDEDKITVTPSEYEAAYLAGDVKVAMRIYDINTVPDEYVNYDYSEDFARYFREIDAIDNWKEKERKLAIDEAAKEYLSSNYYMLDYTNTDELSKRWADIGIPTQEEVNDVLENIDIQYRLWFDRIISRMPPGWDNVDLPYWKDDYDRTNLQVVEPTVENTPILAEIEFYYEAKSRAGWDINPIETEGGFEYITSYQEKKAELHNEFRIFINDMEELKLRRRKDKNKEIEKSSSSYNAILYSSGFFDPSIALENNLAERERNLEAIDRFYDFWEGKCIGELSYDIKNLGWHDLYLSGIIVSENNVDSITGLYIGIMPVYKDRYVSYSDDAGTQEEQDTIIEDYLEEQAKKMARRLELYESGLFTMLRNFDIKCASDYEDKYIMENPELYRVAVDYLAGDYNIYQLIAQMKIMDNGPEHTRAVIEKREAESQGATGGQYVSYQQAVESDMLPDSSVPGWFSGSKKSDWNSSSNKFDKTPMKGSISPSTNKNSWISGSNKFDKSNSRKFLSQVIAEAKEKKEQQREENYAKHYKSYSEVAGDETAVIAAHLKKEAEKAKAKAEKDRIYEENYKSYQQVLAEAAAKKAAAKKAAAKKSAAKKAAAKKAAAKKVAENKAAMAYCGWLLPIGYRGTVHSLVKTFCRKYTVRSAANGRSETEYQALKALGTKMGSNYQWRKGKGLGGLYRTFNSYKR